MSVIDDTALASSGNAPETRRRWLRPSQTRQQAERRVPTLAEQAAAAEERLAVLEACPALFEAPDKKEIDDKIKARRELRALVLEDEVLEEKARLKAKQEEASRLRSLGTKSAAEQDRRRNEVADITRWQQRAGDKAGQLTSKAAQLAETAKLLVSGKRAIIGGIVVLLVWSAVNVQQQLVPRNDTADPLFWLSYGLDITLGGTLVLLMLTSATTARAGMQQRQENIKSWKWSRYLQEASILAASLALNTGSHLRAGDLVLAAKSSIPPIMVGMLVWAYNHVTSQLSATLLKLTDDLETHEQLVRDLEASRTEADEQRRRADEMELALRDQASHAEKLDAEAAQLRAERDSRPAVSLDETSLALLGYAQRGFEGMAEGTLTASIATDGGGVPAGGQLATRLRLSKPIANDVRDLMKKLVRGNAKIVVELPDQVERPMVPMLSRAQ